MKKLFIFGMIGAVALVAIATKTNVVSYAGTFFRHMKKEANNQIPTKFELERVRHEIAALDGDISQMVRPIAEYKSVIEKMRKDITRNQTNIEEQKRTMLAVLDDLKESPKHLEYGGKRYSAEQVQRQLARDTESLKHLEKSTRTAQQVLEAKEQALKATQEQLAKVISKKREYEVRLAQLEAEEETLNIARIGSDVKFDSSRATQIEDALAAIEQRQDVARHEIALKNGDLANIPLNDRTKVAPSNLDQIRNYLEGGTEAEKAASNK
jgi:chromosome segregation ATPase